MPIHLRNETLFSHRTGSGFPLALQYAHPLQLVFFLLSLKFDVSIPPFSNTYQKQITKRLLYKYLIEETQLK